MSFLFPSRPTRATSQLGAEISAWTSQVPPIPDSAFRDHPVRNPWIPAALIRPGDWPDERHWLSMERDPAVAGPIEGRINQLLHGGVVLEQGEGEGSAELLDFWRFALAEHPVTTLTALWLRSIFRGWECFEIVGAFRDWRPAAGSVKRVFAPVMMRDALTWNFRWTAGRDLIYCPGGIPVQGYRMSSLPARMKWACPTIGATSNPYGAPLHGGWLLLDHAYRELSEAGVVQMKQSQGILQFTDTLDIMGELSAGNQAAAAEAVEKIRSMVAELQASGILYNSGRFKADWIELTSALEGWIQLFVWFGESARSYYSGGNLSGSATGAQGSRALGEVHERQQRNRAGLDALRFGEEFRAKFLRPWSAWNAGVIAPDAFPASAATPRLEDVPLSAVPIVTFPALASIGPDDLAVLQAVREAGVDEEDLDGLPEDEREALRVRVDVRAMLRNARIPLLEPGEIGATLDLSRQEPPMGFGAQDLEGLEDGEQPAELDPDEQRPVRSRRR